MNFSRLFFNKSRSKLASPLILRRFFPDGFPPAGLSEKWKREGNGEESAKGKREGSLSPQSPHSFPFSYAGYHRRVYSSVKSLLAGATLACLTGVILFAFSRLGRHFSGMHAYWCIDSYAPMSANKIFKSHSAVPL